MRKLVWSAAFLRSFRREVTRHPEYQKKLEKTLTMLLENPFDSRLSTHKLKGALSGIWACSAGADLRILFEFVKSEAAESDVFLVGIGSHDEVY